MQIKFSAFKPSSKRNPSSHYRSGARSFDDDYVPLVRKWSNKEPNSQSLHNEQVLSDLILGAGYKPGMAGLGRL